MVQLLYIRFTLNHIFNVNIILLIHLATFFFQPAEDSNESKISPAPSRLLGQVQFSLGPDYRTLEHGGRRPSSVSVLILLLPLSTPWHLFWLHDLPISTFFRQISLKISISLVLYPMLMFRMLSLKGIPNTRMPNIKAFFSGRLSVYLTGCPLGVTFDNYTQDRAVLNTSLLMFMGI